jgi:hypothetical protein
MKNTLLSLACVLALGVSVQAAAQTCASPLPISDPNGSNSAISGDLCAATNSLPAYGGTVSPQNDIVYSFTYNNAASGNIAVTQGGEGTWAGGTAAVYLMPSPCSTSTDPIAFGFPGSPMAVNGLTNGSVYYVIFTSDPGGPANACGTFNLDVTGTLPVKLQGFSVE